MLRSNYEYWDCKYLHITICIVSLMKSEKLNGLVIKIMYDYWRQDFIIYFVVPAPWSNHRTRLRKHDVPVRLSNRCPCDYQVKLVTFLFHSVTPFYHPTSSLNFNPALNVQLYLLSPLLFPSSSANVQYTTDPKQLSLFTFWERLLYLIRI